MKKLEDMSINEIESYGASIQKSISDSMVKLLEDTKCIDLGGAGACLNDLSSATDTATKQLTPRGIFRPIVSARRWMGKFDGVEKKLMSLESGLVAEREKLNTVLDGLMGSKDILVSNLKDLKEAEAELQRYVEEMQRDADCDPLRLQAGVNRLKIIASLSALTAQEITKTVLVIGENKEVANQLEDACVNLVPMFRVMMMTTLATKANREAVELRNSLVKTANKLVVDSAKEVQKTAYGLLENRTSALISPETINEANEILQTTVARIRSSATSETQVNMDLVRSLQDTTKSMTELGVLPDKEVGKLE